jgi:hypothetical protein
MDDKYQVKLIFVHKYKDSKYSLRRRLRRLAKEGKATLVNYVHDGFLYAVTREIYNDIFQIRGK